MLALAAHILKRERLGTSELKNKSRNHGREQIGPRNCVRGRGWS